ncbi:MAG: hypothetical protein ABIE22_01175 [archaeon]
MDEKKALIEIVDRLDPLLESRFANDATGHAAYHLAHVYSLAIKIQKQEGGSLYTIGIAAKVHEEHRAISLETGKYCPPVDSLQAVSALLQNVGVSEEHVPKILECVEHHEEYAFAKGGIQTDLKEALIIQDADNLAALGMIGWCRGMMYAGAKGIPLWLPEISVGRADYEEGVNDPSEIHHFNHKLLKLRDNMNTRAAGIMAVPLHDRLVKGINWFTEEWREHIESNPFSI